MLVHIFHLQGGGVRKGDSPKYASVAVRAETPSYWNMNFPETWIRQTCSGCWTKAHRTRSNKF